MVGASTTSAPRCLLELLAVKKADYRTGKYHSHRGQRKGQRCHELQCAIIHKSYRG